MVMMNRGDLDFILKQILIAEANSRGEDLSTFIPRADSKSVPGSLAGAVSMG